MKNKLSCVQKLALIINQIRASYLLSIMIRHAKNFDADRNSLEMAISSKDNMYNFDLI